MEELTKYTKEMFEDIKHIDKNGNEYWDAREIQKVFEYVQWRRFESVIDKAKNACENSKINVNDHFANVGKMINLAKGAERNINNYKLSRYACVNVNNFLYKKWN